MKLLLCSSGHLLILVQRVIALNCQGRVSMEVPPTWKTADSLLSLLSPLPTTQVSVCFNCFSMVYKHTIMLNIQKCLHTSQTSKFQLCMSMNIDWFLYYTSIWVIFFFNILFHVTISCFFFQHTSSKQEVHREFTMSIYFRIWLFFKQCYSTIFTLSKCCSNKDSKRGFGNFYFDGTFWIYSNSNPTSLLIPY